ncbi:MAG: VOC family protein [Thermoproteota archaeon]|nr:VOC family protein [Thermoproteota archaeon]
MVPNVDDYWKLVKEMRAQIVIPIADRYYGLRNFIISDPDGFGVRFASPSSQKMLGFSKIPLTIQKATENENAKKTGLVGFEW